MRDNTLDTLQSGTGGFDSLPVRTPMRPRRNRRVDVRDGRRRDRSIYVRREG
jgi:hypothetical protein